MTIDVVVMTAVQCALLALHKEWCGEGGTHFLVELGLRTSVATSLREGDAAAVWGHHAQVGHNQPVIRGVNTTAVELGGAGSGRGRSQGGREGDGYEWWNVTTLWRLEGLAITEHHMQSLAACGWSQPTL